MHPGETMERDMRAVSIGTTAFARWLPLACFTVTVGSTLSVLVLQAMLLTDVADVTLARLFGWIAGWLGFTALLAAGVVGAIFRLGLLEATRFHDTTVQDVTLILMMALIAATLAILLVKGGGLLWASASMIMAAVGLIPLLAVRLRKMPSGAIDAR
jgi:hypothetical protein